MRMALDINQLRDLHHQKGGLDLQEKTKLLPPRRLLSDTTKCQESPSRSDLDRLEVPNLYMLGELLIKTVPQELERPLQELSVGLESAADGMLEEGRLRDKRPTYCCSSAAFMRKRVSLENWHCKSI